MNRDITLSPCQALAALLWVVALPLAASTFLVTDPVSTVRVATMSVVVMGAAATITVRGFLMRWEGELRNAFQLGRDSAVDAELRTLARPDGYTDGYNR